jgi:tetratricopeptide (TPR) repeat protein
MAHSSRSHPTEDAPEPELTPEAHWPHAAPWCKAKLDLESIEPLAVRVLARGLLSQRLVAFVGAGVSAAYGRMTWPGLMEALWDRIDEDTKRSESARSVWEAVSKALWDQKKAKFLEHGDHAVKAQVIANALQLLPRETPANELAESIEQQAEPLQQEAKWQLADFHGFVDWIVKDVTPSSSPKDALDQRKTDLDAARKAIEYERPESVGLTKVLNVLKNNFTAHKPGAPSPRDLRNELIKALAWQSTQRDSPLRLLAIEWGIRRFITTNYDGEIERGLCAAGFMPTVNGAPEVQGNQYSVLNFGRHETGQALRFALEGPRRHAAVLHLHGDVADARSLIVTESHYQQLYLDDHPVRDLVNNTTFANFAANPVLFVGSDVSEDDVLRPMRQFMSAEGHRSDRMAVALFTSWRGKHDRACRRAQLWLKYGVYSIDVGRAETASGPSAKDDDELWLVRLLTLQMAFKRAKGARAKSKVADGLQLLGSPISIEGVEVAEHQELKLNERLQALIDSVRSLQNVGKNDPAIGRVEVMFDITVSWISSCFVCAKLIDLHRRATRVIEEDARLALPFIRRYDPPPNRKGTSGREPVVYRRHGVMLSHPVFAGRFQHVAPQSKAVFDEHIGELCQAIQSNPAYRRRTGRRILIVCAARGHGKGGQFDRLLETNRSAAGTTDRPHLDQLLKALQGYGGGLSAPGYAAARVVHANLSFSNELGPIISQVIGVMAGMAPRSGLAESTDQIEMLGRAMHGLSTPGANGRLLLVLGNAGVLFDADGKPKNGQIRRVMRTLLSPRFDRARLDIIMYVGESQMPEDQRIAPDNAATLPARQAAELRTQGQTQDLRRRRRLHRLNIEGQQPNDGPILVHALGKTRVSELAQAYFPGLSTVVGWLLPDGPHPPSGATRFPPKSSEPDELARALYFATGGSRLAQTLLLAWFEASVASNPAPEAGQAHGHRLIHEACASLRSAPAGSAVEAVVEYVLDRWASWHQLRHRLPPSALPGRVSLYRDRGAARLPRIVQALSDPLTPIGWKLATELLWHLSAFSHPVEPDVLLACPLVRAAADKLCEPKTKLGGIAATASECVTASLELLVHWCLVFRIERRPMPETPQTATCPGAPGQDPQQRIRYTLHRHIQRHFVCLMGGRNVETTAWDQFTTTVYASLPDEAPSLRPEVHQALVDVVQELTGYPAPHIRAAKQSVPSKRDSGAADVGFMVGEADRIRAAYYLVRSTYSLGVVSHLDSSPADRGAAPGHLEQYRRLVRWIIHAARYWERRHRIGRTSPGKPPDDEKHIAHGWCTAEQSLGIFYPGELIWLYNECGVISLAQGKLHDAEQLLTMAETAARMVESDNTGSLHTRIRIHSALVQIERGRPQRARNMLVPIANRRNGHPVPPLIARFYLGLVEHLGGNYASALDCYDEALRGLRKEGRARATAFVLMYQADVQYGLKKHDIDKALATADEAISLAQQGGHEDLRVAATLARIRICIDAGRTDNENIFEHLSFAQRYAVLMDIPRLACDARELRARMLMRQGELHLSANDATAGLEIAAMYDLKLKKAHGLLTLSEILHRRGETASARSLASMGREIAVACDYFACVRGFKELELTLSRKAAANGS